MFLEQQISILEIISEESCDTEDWINDAENSTLHFKIYSNWNKKQLINYYFKLQ